MSKEKISLLRNSNLEINQTEFGLDIRIETERLVVRSIREGDFTSFSQLLKDEKTMKTYNTGALTDDQVLDRFNTMLQRWKSTNPFGEYAIILKETGELIGTVILGRGTDTIPGICELGYIIGSKFWGKKYASEAVFPIILKLSPILAQEGYLINTQALDSIVATARLDNPASCKILENLGFSYIKTIEKHGALRNLYLYKVQKLKLETDCRETNFELNEDNWYQFFSKRVCSYLEDFDQKKWNNALKHKL